MSQPLLVAIGLVLFALFTLFMFALPLFFRDLRRDREDERAEH